MAESPPEYPHWVFQPGHAPVMVSTEEEFQALEGTWYLTPWDAAAASEAAPEPPAPRRRS